MRKTILITAIGIMLMLSGCTQKQHGTEKDQQAENLLIVIDDSMSYRIYVDKATKVMYLRTKQGYGEALCVMVDADGKPLLWRGEDHETD